MSEREYFEKIIRPEFLGRDGENYTDHRVNFCWRRYNHLGTHSPDCYSFGVGHYECAVREIERLREIESMYEGLCK